VLWVTVDPEPADSAPSRIRQGWHPDPYGVHESRYFSADGQPTKLVRDAGQEAYDDPPDLESAPSSRQDPGPPLADAGLVNEAGPPESTGPVGPTQPDPAGSMAPGDEGPEAGWYADPLDPQQARYWEGDRWSERLRSLESFGIEQATGTLAPPPEDALANVERACPVCHRSQEVSVSATSMFCPACQRDMFFMSCRGCSNVALVNADAGEAWTCPWCNLRQPAELHTATASGNRR
jgi:hypothetical protein